MKRKTSNIVLAFAFLALACSAHAAHRIPLGPQATTLLIHRVFRGFAAAVNPAVVTASPGTITFSASDPDSSSVSGSSTSTVSWQMNGGNSNWSMTVSAASATLTGCTSIPVSAIQFSCGSVTATGTGGPNGSCANGTFTLSTTPQTIASGTKQGNGSFSTTVSFTFTDAWNYPASSSCSVSINYTVTGN